MSDVVLSCWGAFGFGLLIGWYVYYINRYRKGDIQLSDLTTLVGVIGGGGITALFGSDKAGMFGAYGLGLALGFFAYLSMLFWIVSRSQAFTLDWFIDGRRADPTGSVRIPEGVRQSGAAMDEARNANAVRIVAACEEEWETYADDCSGFVRAVANKLGLPMQGNADDIVDTIQTPSWIRLASGQEAADKAADGLFVLAGMKGAEQSKPQPHGHVVVVVPGTPANGSYPVAYWGSLGGVGSKARTINWAWVAADRDRVTYAARAI